MPRPQPIVVPAPTLQRVEPDNTGVAAIEGLTKILSAYKKNEEAKSSAEAVKALLSGDISNLTEDNYKSVSNNPTLMTLLSNAAQKKKSQQDLQTSFENFNSNRLTPTETVPRMRPTETPGEIPVDIKQTIPGEVIAPTKIEQQRLAPKVLGNLGNVGETVLAKMVGQTVAPELPKEFNVPNDLDTFLSAKAGQFNSDYSTPQGRQQMLQMWGVTPSLQKEFVAWKKSFAPESITYLQTGEGFVPVSQRTPTGVIGKPTGFLKPTPETEIKQGTQLGTLKDSIARIKENFSPEFVGPVSGRFGELKGKVKDLPEKQVMFYADVRDIADLVLRARSGAQINETEFQRMMKWLPSPNSPSQNFGSMLKRFEEEVDSIIKNRQDQLSGSGYKVTNPTPKSGVTQKQPTTPETIGKYKVKVR